MKNSNWRRVAVILALILIGGIGFGFGVVTGAETAAEFFIDKATDIMGWENIEIDITRTELMDYYRKLKGGI